MTSLAFLYILWWSTSRSTSMEAAEVGALRTRGYTFRADAVSQRQGLFLGTKRSLMVFLLCYGATQVLRVSSVFSAERGWIEFALPVAGFQLSFLYVLLLFRPSGALSALEVARLDPRYEREIRRNRNRMGPPTAVEGVMGPPGRGVPPLVQARGKPPGK